MMGNKFNFFRLMAAIALISSISIPTVAETQTSKIAVVDARLAIFSSNAAKNALQAFEESTDYLSLKAKYESASADFQAMAKESETKRLTWSSEELADHQKKWVMLKLMQNWPSKKLPQSKSN